MGIGVEDGRETRRWGGESRMNVLYIQIKILKEQIQYVTRMRKMSVYFCIN